MNFMNSEYIVKPHELGSKRVKSWFLSVPVAVAREYNFSRNTVFALRPDKCTGILTFQKIYEENMDNLIPGGKSLRGPNQQVSSDVHSQK